MALSMKTKATPPGVEVKGHAPTAVNGLLAVGGLLGGFQIPLLERVANA